MFGAVKNILKQLIAYLTRKLNGPYVQSMIVKTEQGLFVVDQNDLTVGWKLRRKARFADNELRWLTARISGETSVLVVGAHVGSLAVPISQICKELVAIEANPHTFQLLSQTFLLNNLSNCTPINIAASDKEETISFLLNKLNSGGSKRVPLFKKRMYYYDQPKEIQVKAYSLDAYLTDLSFDMVIMDIEGSEYFALKGMQQILSNAKVLAIEFLPHHLKNVSGVSVETFLTVIAPHFSSLFIPSKNLHVKSDEFLNILSDMYKRNQEEDMILFSKD